LSVAWSRITLGLTRWRPFPAASPLAFTSLRVALIRPVPLSMRRQTFMCQLAASIWGALIRLRSTSTHPQTHQRPASHASRGAPTRTTELSLRMPMSMTRPCAYTRVALTRPLPTMTKPLIRSMDVSHTSSAAPIHLHPITSPATLSLIPPHPAVMADAPTRMTPTITHRLTSMMALVPARIAADQAHAQTPLMFHALPAIPICAGIQRQAIRDSTPAVRIQSRGAWKRAHTTTSPKHMWNGPSLTAYFLPMAALHL